MKKLFFLLFSLLFVSCKLSDNNRYVMLQLSDIKTVNISDPFDENYELFKTHYQVNYNDVITAVAIFTGDDDYTENCKLEYNNLVFECIEKTENRWKLRVITKNHFKTKLKLYAENSTSTSQVIFVN